jgi:hypothetical protein
MTQFAQNTDRLRRVLLDAVTRLPAAACPHCPAPASL